MIFRLDFVTDYSNLCDIIQDVRTFDFRDILYRAYMGYVCLSNGIGIIRHWVAPTKKVMDDVTSSITNFKFFFTQIP